MDDSHAIPCETPEAWRAVGCAPGYEVSDLGRVRRVAGGKHVSERDLPRVLASRPLPRGHLIVTMSVAGKAIHRLVHRLVAGAFVDPIEGKPCVLHRDDNPGNNRPSNLFWGTKPENSADMVAKDRQCKGERVSGAKLTPEAVRGIRDMIASGLPQKRIALSFGISQSNVSMIATGTIWGHVK